MKELLNDFGTKNNTMPEWLIQEERIRVLDLVQGISAHLRAANTIWPDYMVEFTERRLQMDKALECCNMLQDELQAIVEMVPADKNRYTQIVLEIENAFKSWMVLNYKVMSRMQIQGIYEVYKELFGKEN